MVSLLQMIDHCACSTTVREQNLGTLERRATRLRALRAHGHDEVVRASTIGLRWSELRPAEGREVGWRAHHHRRCLDPG